MTSILVTDGRVRYYFFPSISRKLLSIFSQLLLVPSKDVSGHLQEYSQKKNGNFSNNKISHKKSFFLTPEISDFRL